MRGVADAKLRQQRARCVATRDHERVGRRPSTSGFSAGVQHELLPRVSASVGYFRRINGNFFVLDNEALGRRDFTE
jgi:hypothetical protein